MWHVCFVNAALDLACFIDFYGWYSDWVLEWEAGIKKRKIMDCWDIPDAETLRTKETETVKLYFVDSEELWAEPAGRTAIDTSALSSLLVSCNLSIPYPVNRFYLFLGGFCEMKVLWLFLLCQIHWCRRETKPESYLKKPQQTAKLHSCLPPVSLPKSYQWSTQQNYSL